MVPRLSALLASFLLLVPNVGAQQVTGRVTNQATGEPLAAVQVFIAGSGIGALSQQNGRYLLLNVPAGTHTLTAERIGYRSVSQQVAVAAAATVVQDFALSEEALGLDEIVVTGTPGGTQRRAIGNSVVSVDASEVSRAVAVATVQDLLSGRSPGLQYGRVSGTVGAGARIHVRGWASFNLGTNPLIFVDGVRVNNSSAGPLRNRARASNVLDDFNPGDIESVEIIKGPAAATLYGTEASAGVIQIITKRGVEGAPSFTMSVRQGANYVKNPADRLGPKWSCTDKFKPPCDENGTLMGYNPYVEANRLVHEGAFPWDQDNLYAAGRSQSYNVDVRGGTQTVRYFLSANYDDDVGSLSYNWDKAFRTRANIGAVFSESVSFDASLGYVDGETRYNMPQVREGSEWNDMAWGTGYCLPRISGDECPLLGFQERLPSDIALIDTRRAYSRFTGSGTLNFTPNEWLTSRFILGFDKTWDRNSRLSPLDTEPPNAYVQTVAGTVELEKPTIENVSVDWSATASIGLNERLGTKTSVGLQYYRKQFEMFGNVGSGFPSPLSTTVNQTPPSNAVINYDYQENKSVGVYVQEEVSWNDRLFVTGAIRFDDNSAFGSEFDFEKYPKVSATWVLSEESFWNIDLVNALRLRGAWGKAGRQPDTFARTFQYDVGPGVGGKAALIPSGPGNPLVGPETSTELELGFDVALLEDRISAEFSWFTKKTEGALLGIPLAPSLGFPGETQRNIGQIDNWGWELSVRSRIYESQDFTFALALTGEHVDNEIKDLGEFPGENRRGTSIVKIGFPYPNYTQRGFQVDARYDPNGRVADTWGRKLSADCDVGVPLGPTDQHGWVQGGEIVPCEEITGNKIFVGRAFTPYKFSVAPRIGLFNNAVEIHALVDGAYGRWILNVFRSANQFKNSYGARCDCDPFFSAEHAELRISEQKWYDASFWKLREVGFLYNFPETLASRVGAERVALSFSAREIATLWVAQAYVTGGVKVLDPEFDSFETRDNNSNGATPPLSNINLTLRVNF